MTSPLLRIFIVSLLSAQVLAHAFVGRVGDGKVAGGVGFGVTDPIKFKGSDVSFSPS